MYAPRYYINRTQLTDPRSANNTAIQQILKMGAQLMAAGS